MSTWFIRRLLIPVILASLLSACHRTDQVQDSIVNSVVAGDLAKVQAAINQDPNLVFTGFDHGVTLLEFAARNDQREVAAFLLSRKAPVNESDDLGYTPLHVASS